MVGIDINLFLQISRPHIAPLSDSAFCLLNAPANFPLGWKRAPGKRHIAFEGRISKPNCDTEVPRQSLSLMLSPLPNFVSWLPILKNPAYIGGRRGTLLRFAPARMLRHGTRFQPIIKPA